MRIENGKVLAHLITQYHLYLVGNTTIKHFRNYFLLNVEPSWSSRILTDIAELQLARCIVNQSNARNCNRGQAQWDILTFQSIVENHAIFSLSNADELFIQTLSDHFVPYEFSHSTKQSIHCCDLAIPRHKRADCSTISAR